MTADQTFVERWEAAWRNPVELFPKLFDREGTLFQSGMARPIGREAIAGHIAARLAAVPDFRVRPDRWAEQGDDLFIEWTASGTLAGQPSELRGASRFTLRDGRIVEERAYFDTAMLAGSNAAAAESR